MKTFWVFLIIVALIVVYIFIAGNKDPYAKKESIDFEDGDV